MSAEKKVARGIAFLDKVNPGWESKIDLDRLNLNHSRACILGQLYGDVDLTPRFFSGPVFIIRRGFVGDRHGSNHREWCRVILARQALQAVEQRRLTATTEPLLARSV